MFIKSWLAPQTLSNSSTMLPEVLTAPPPPPPPLPRRQISSPFSPQAKLLPVPCEPISKHSKQHSKLQKIISEKLLHKNRNNNCSNNKFTSMNGINYINIDYLYDMDKKFLENSSVFKFNPSIPTLTSTFSLGGRKRERISTENTTKRHKPPLSRRTDFTIGEKSIMAGLCRNRGCMLPHLEQTMNDSSEHCERTARTEKKIDCYFPPIHNFGKSALFFKKSCSSCSSNCSSRSNSGGGGSSGGNRYYNNYFFINRMKSNDNNNSNNSPAEESHSLPKGKPYRTRFPILLTDCKDYTLCLSLNTDSKLPHEKHENSPASSSPVLPKTISNLLQTPPNTPDTRKKYLKSEKVKIRNRNKNDSNVPSCKKKMHLIVLVPKAEEEEDIFEDNKHKTK